MKKWMLLPCTLLATVLAAQTNGPVPAGTALMVRLDTTLATFSNKAGDPFRASITQPVVVNGQTLIPVGASVEGRKPLGLAVVGGLVLSQAVTLYITPVLYVYLDRLGSMFSRRRGPVPVAIPAPAE